jgi:hypothetical protein
VRELRRPAGGLLRGISYAAAEPWTGTVTFEGPDGTIRSARQVLVARGERRELDLTSDCVVRQ